MPRVRQAHLGSGSGRPFCGATAAAVSQLPPFFMMTSNLGASALKPRPGLPDDGSGPPPAPTDDAALEAAAFEAARTFFRAELLNRIDEVVVLRRLNEGDVVRIAGASLRALAASVRERHGVELEVEPAALECVAAAGFSPLYGARELRRTIERLVEAPLAELVLSGELARHDTWRLAVEGGSVRVLPVPARR